MNTLVSTTRSKSTATTLQPLPVLRPGQTVRLDWRRIPGRIPADAYLRNQCWEEMLLSFEEACQEACARYSRPIIRRFGGEKQSAAWVARTGISFEKLVVFQHRHHHQYYFFIALENSRDCNVINLIAGLV